MVMSKSLLIKYLQRTGVVLLVIGVFLITPVGSQAPVVLFGLFSGSPKAMTTDASGNLNVTVVSGGGAPTSATYITQTADATLSAEQALDALATGILRVDTVAGVVTSLTTSADIFANISDETGGTGLLVGSISPVITTNLDLETTGVRFSAADGVLTILGLGNGNDENLTIDFDNAAANTVAIASGTGVRIIQLPGMIDIIGFYPALELKIGGDVTGTGARTNATDKISLFGSAHYTNAEEPMALIFGYSQAATNQVYFGGGAGQMNAATSIFFYTAATNTTLTGTLTLTITPTLVQNAGRGAFSTKQAITVDAATTFAVTSSYITLACTGAETINTITGGSSGMVLYIEQTDTNCTIADDDAATAANAIDLTGTATNDVGAVKKSLVLFYNGTDWYEISESDN